MNALEIPLSFFETVPAIFYNLIRVLIFFIFDYEIIGGDTSVLTFINPFNGVGFRLDIPALDIGFYDEILEFFGFDFISLTFFEIMVGPGIILVLAYAVIKYLLPTS